MIGSALYRYPLDRGQGLTVDFEVEEGVFVPTHTTQLLVRAACRALPREGKLLDLGCGIGVCGLVLAKGGTCRPPVYFSDLSEKAIELTRRNAQRLGVEAVVRQGSLFAPWAGERFDAIVDDVSGVCEEIARISPWFPEGVECQTGRDGAGLICQVLEQAPRYLSSGGMLLFPVLSLSDEGRILRAAESSFAEVTQVAEQSWFLPEELSSRLDRLRPLMEEGLIRLEHRFGSWLWSTRIYRARR